MIHSPSDREQDFLDAVKAELDDSAVNLDSATVARVQRIRRDALQSSPTRSTWWISAGAFATLVVAITAVFLWTATPIPEPNGPNGVLEKLDLLSSVDDIEFYDELDFYQWLSEDAPTG